ncbi:MAG: cadherin-like beta sandwich domain-containing protein, partial [bacterium]
MKLKSGLNLFSKILIIQAMALALASCTISHSKENQAAITATGGTETSRTIFLALNLSDLSVSSAALSPEFSPRHVTYSATTSNETITVTASVPDPTFIITVDDQEIASGSSSQPIALSKGINYVIITVASADRTLQTSYLLSINKTVDNGSTSGVSSYKDVPFQSYIGCDKNTPNVLNIGVVGLQYYIPIQAPDGNIRYAHDGATFTLNQNGQVVLARNMDYLLSPQIYLPADAEKVTITSTGTILVKMPGQVSHQVVGQIQLATFMNPDGLAAIEFGLYAETADSGTPMTSQAYSNFFTGDIITYCEGVIYSDYTTPPLVVDQAKLHIRINNAPIATYFPLMQADGSVAYTNDTEFMVDQAGYIRHYSSKLLLQPQLTIPLWSMLDLSSLSINDTGTVTVADQNGNTQQLGQLQIVQFMNPNGLQQSLQDPSVYRDTADSGQPIYMNAGGTQGVMDFYSMEIKKLRDYPARPVLD